MTHADYMLRAIELAKKGAGWTNPNPMVGAVLVKDGEIIAEDYHHRCGECHAERNALLKCDDKKAMGATLYVTLEPCCHQGKTPPCTDIIIEKGIKRVFIGSRDPNPKVAGKGAGILREHGIEVTEDFMNEECNDINPIFMHYIIKKEPYVTIKYAMTLDGKIATYTGASKWITGERARAHVHELRSKYAAVMAGIETVLRDDPLLNARTENIKQERDGDADKLPSDNEIHQPLRIICDSRLRIPPESKIVRTASEYKTMVVCAMDEEKFEKSRKRAELEKCGINVLNMPETKKSSAGKKKQVDLKALMHVLGNKDIDSVLIEGGGTIHYEALKAGIVNHICAYIAPKLFGGRNAKTPVEGDGIELPKDAFMLKNQSIIRLGEDILIEGDI